jgi:hypothetical protein
MAWRARLFTITFVVVLTVVIMLVLAAPALAGVVDWTVGG